MFEKPYLKLPTTFNFTFFYCLFEETILSTSLIYTKTNKKLKHAANNKM